MSADQLALALRIIEDTWEQVRQIPFIAVNAREQMQRLPEVSEQTAWETSAQANALLARIDAVDASALPADVASTLAVAKTTLRRRSFAGPWYWTLFDPLGVGFWAPYAPTAYGGGWLLSQLYKVFAKHPLDSVGDVDRYLALIEDFARLVRQLDARTRGQAERGITMPRVQLEQARVLMARQQEGAATALARGEGKIRAAIEARIAAAVVPAFEDFRSWLDEPAQLEAAGEEVGMAHLPDGAAIYAELVSQHLTLDSSIEEVHAYGLTRLGEIRAAMQAVADDLGVADPRAALERISNDAAWHESSTEGVAAVFERYIERMKPHVDSQFRFKPVADYGVQALPAELSASMTFGFYAEPNPLQPKGLYLFNAGNLTQQPLANVAALTFHELVPGHHFHMASQLENESLVALRRSSFVNAFNEGWAEYAGGLASELGLYTAPEERFGRLMMDAFLTTRLVVDTGMNALGWNLEKARDFMRENAFVSESEVLTESVRYSCDLPGQSLAYKMGEPFLLAQRARMKAALGDAFDIRDFHDAVLRPGALPLSEVAANIDRAIAGQLSRREGSGTAT